MRTALVRLVYIMGLHLLAVEQMYAQLVPANSVDSLIMRENLLRTVQSYYLRPLLEIQQGATNVQGNERFSEVRADMLRQASLGIRIGYRSGSFEAETGISSVRVGAGYKFIPEYDAGLRSRVRSTGYTQIPFIVRFSFWRPTERFSLRAGVGLAFNFDANKRSLGSSSTLVEYIYSANGNPTEAAKTVSKYTREPKFWSGEISLSTYHQLSKRFSITVEGKRLIGSNNIVTLSNVREVYKPADIQQFIATGGANAYNLNLGISYQFGFRNYYRLNEQ